MTSAQPTPYPEINTLLNLLLAKVQSVLAENFVGLYLYGSLAGGDFNLATSDIDFLVITAGEIPTATIAGLEKLHREFNISDRPWARKLEGAYIPQEDIRRFGLHNIPRPVINEGKFYLAHQGRDWVIQRHQIREQGVVVAGPDPAPLIDPVRPEEVRQAVRAILDEWWAPLLAQPEILQRDDYQAYGILSMCRALYTLAQGTIASKSVSARWTQAQLGVEWAGLIAAGLAWRPGMGMDRRAETLAFIRYVVDFSRQ